MKTPTILITGDNGECLPTPYGGIMKRCLLHAGFWRTYGAQVWVHVHHHHENENDLDAGASYFFDYQRPPTRADKVAFVLRWFLRDPLLFVRYFALVCRLSPFFEWTFLYYAARTVLLDRKVKEVRPTVLVTETGGHQTLGSVLVAKRNNVPIAFENYAEIQYKAKEDGKNIAPQYGKLWQYILDGVDLVVPASSHCAKGPLAYLPNDEKVRVVYSGINFDIFNAHAGDDKAPIRASFGLPADRFIVMAVGALRMRKGHDHLFEALLHIPKDLRAKVFVVLCGMGDVVELRQKASELGFGDDSLRIFSGLTEERLAELYSTADIFCFPSVTPRECMGMAMKEAMAIGLPVAAYGAGGISEAVEDGVNGYLAPVGDKQALADAVARLMALSADERAVMGRKNADKARRLFDIKLTSRRLYDLLVSLVSTRS